MADEKMSDALHDETLEMAAEIVSAYVSNNRISCDDLPEFIRSVHGALTSVTNGAAEHQPTTQKPAVAIRKSVTPDYIVCLEDGKHLKMLKRYLRTNYNMTPEQYRAKWNLAADYPMVAPSYAAQRSEFAKKIGLGRSSRRNGR